MKAKYGRSLSSQLGHFPVWDIGSEVKPGDYGLLNDDCFTKIGDTASEFQTTIELESSSPSFWEYTSKGTETISGEGSARIELPETRTEMVLRFANSYSLYMRAANSQVTSISNIEEVARQLHNHPQRWDYSRYVVLSVRRAASLILLMNTSRNSLITLRATLADLAHMQAGRADSEMRIEVAGDAGLKHMGKDVAIYVDLIRVTRFGGKSRLAAMPGIMKIESYELVKPSA